MKHDRENIIFRILPRVSIVPVLGVSLLQFVVYYVPKLLNRGRDFVDLSTRVDAAIPFTPFFVLFYVIAFLQWVVYYLILAREEKAVRIRFLTADTISKLLCMVLFLVMPTAIVRPDVSGSGVFRFCCRVVYACDEPTNLFPSMHCLLSWFAMRLALEEHRLGRVPEVSRSIVRGFSGEMIQCVNRKEFKNLEEYLSKVSRAELETYFERLISRRKWRLDQKLEAAVDDAAEAVEDVGEVFVKFHAVRTSVLTALVLLSTVFIKQHFVADMISAVAIAELTLFISGKITDKITKKDAE